jgi:phosphomevalonate kinase
LKRVLALTGKRFSGKDTLAAMLIDAAKARGIDLRSHAFAAESKRLFVDERAADGEEISLDRLLTDRSYKEEQRPRLTAFTVESIARDPLVFCRSVADRSEAVPHPSLITDVRLRLEVDHLRSRFDLHLVRMARSDASRAASGWSYAASADEHPTETELDDASLWDEIVTNDGSLDELARKANDLMARWLDR